MRLFPRVLTAALLALPLALVASPPAQAADPTTLTSGFYVDPNSSPALWVAATPSDGRAPAVRDNVATKPMARWFGNWSGTIGTATGAYVGAADARDKLPVLVAYNIPNRDICGGHSGGGAGSVTTYNEWIAAFASGIGTRPAVVILEPDSLGDTSCMTAAQIAERNSLLNNAITQFNQKAPNTWVYLDAGNPGWRSATTMAANLNAAGLSRAHGFSLNVSNYYTTAQNITYANAVNAALSASSGYTRPFVVDTSRNGNGSNNGEWCNSAGRKIGTPSQKGGGAEMLLWIKTPGESDGNCGVGAGSVAGQFLPEVAYKMVYGY
ncbi:MULTISPECIES: glycoside hydrolase family 6 protein [Streptomyces]|uniref:Glucanase n=1 Tax=Streptomyces clavifer TaxID=68188 RepID=A0ABS4VFU8_9ACTN|nr:MULTISPECIES: glycoside hydrolase family 6 protein [Streptomyces]KQX94495.1 endoglucanase [Streptomyces sp. Root1319]KQZ05543.1 endoglucanase [Streptomyces sp. Root55]MBP2362740.1 endoglucanase [Streptomyces clavifer]MDX2742718.1 glycoside hydrolase family 6 protein [Streptomyces sp. NRRL_B-2557]MDX3061549.1 glycoside hydrolase family 6 protein [Streptomyces sp. ND04-05B]